MEREVVIRADGSAEIGLGHLVRCMALAQTLKKDFSIQFICKAIPEGLIADFQKLDFTVKRITSEEQWLQLLSGKEIVVLDHYDLGSDIQKKIKEIGCKLVCIDDLHDKKFYADLIINHSPGIKPEDYQAQKYTKFALGPAYALLRPSFLKAATKKPKRNEMNSILICFGGSDFKNITKKVLEVVVEQQHFKSINVVLGAAYPHKDSLKELRLPNKITIFESLNEQEMLSIIQKTDLAIIPASGILLETIAGGSLPVICYYADNQKEIFGYFQKNKMLPYFNALEFNSKELKAVLLKVVEEKNKWKKIPFREKIGKSSENNLQNFHILSNIENTLKII